MKVATLILALTVPSAAQTQPTLAAPVSVAGSNMPANFYPHSPCLKPQKVKADGTPRTAAGSAQPSAPIANVAIEQFNAQAVAFNACIKLYVDNARLDMQRILDIANGSTQASTAAIPAGGGNLPAGFYPPSPCIQPVPPDSDAAPDPKAARSRGSARPLHGPRMDEYNRQVHVFNSQAAAFNACAKTYMDNAKRDIELVQGIVRTAVADANAPLADP
jgi:hypothetical protein